MGDISLSEAQAIMQRLKAEGKTIDDFMQERKENPNIGEQMMQPTMGQRLAGVAASMVPFGGIREMRDEYVTQAKKPAGVDRQVIGMTEALTFGALGRINAAAEGLEARAQGAEPEPFSVRLERERRFLDKESGLLGQIAGSISKATPVGGAATLASKGLARVAPAVTKGGAKGFAARTLGNAALGAGLTASYAAAQGKTAEDIQAEALMGAGFGAGTSAIMDMATAIGRSQTFRDTLGRASDLEVAQNVITRIRDRFPDAVVDRLITGGYLDEAEIAQRISASGDDLDAPLIETFDDEMLGELSTIMRQAAENEDVFDAVTKMNDYLLQKQRMAVPEFRASIDDALNTPQVRSRSQLDIAVQKQREQIQPQYEAAVKTLDNQITLPDGTVERMRYKHFKQVVDAAFGDTRSGAALQARREALRTIVPEPKKRAGKRGRWLPNKGKDTRLTGENLIAAIKSLDKMIYDGVSLVSPDSPSIDKSVGVEYLVPLRNQLKQLVYDMDPTGKFPAIDGQYADMFRTTKAYEAGEAALRSVKGDASTFDAFLGTLKGASPAEHAAFVEGLKAQLVTQLEGKSPKTISNYFENNKRKMALIEQAIPGAASLLRENAEKYVAANRLAGLAVESRPATMNPNLGVSGAVANMVDAATAGTAAAQGLPTRAMNSMRRTLSSTADAFPGGYPGRAQALTEMMLQPTGDAIQQVNEQVRRSAQPSAFPGLMGLLGGINVEQ